MTAYGLIIGPEVSETLVGMDTATAERFLRVLFWLRENPRVAEPVWSEAERSGWVADLDPVGDPRAMVFYVLDEARRTLEVTAITWEGNWPA